MSDWPDEDRYCRSCGQRLGAFGDCAFCAPKDAPEASLKLVEDEPEEG